MSRRCPGVTMGNYAVLLCVTSLQYYLQDNYDRRLSLVTLYCHRFGQSYSNAERQEKELLVPDSFRFDPARNRNYKLTIRKRAFYQLGHWDRSWVCVNHKCPKGTISIYAAHAISLQSNELINRIWLIFILCEMIRRKMWLGEAKGVVYLVTGASN